MVALSLQRFFEVAIVITEGFTMFFFQKIPSVRLQEVNDYKQIIDVRTAQEFRSGNLKGSRNIPLDRLGRFQSKDRVYVICETGARSKHAVKYLRKQGVDAINIKGGLARYR